MTDPTTTVRPIDPSGLNRDQRAGRACVVCDKRWPLPSVHIGQLPDGTPVFACRDCNVVVVPS